jgi:hypothetical protein
LISLGFLIGMYAFQNQAHRRAAEVAERGFLLIQSGGGDWIKNPIFSGRRPKPLDGYGTYDEACIERTETLLFGGISRQTKDAFFASSAPLR